MYSAIVIALGFVLAVVLYALLASAWRLLNEEGRSRLRRMLRRNRVEVEPGALATRRCVACTSHAQCDAFLRSGTTGVPEFCPNAEFIALAARRPAE